MGRYVACLNLVPGLPVGLCIIISLSLSVLSLCLSVSGCLLMYVSVSLFLSLCDLSLCP